MLLIPINFNKSKANPLNPNLKPGLQEPTVSMFYRFNPDTDWETCSAVADRVMGTAAAETHVTSVNAFITACRGNCRWDTCTPAARGQGWKSNARWSIARTNLTKAILASTYLENEKPGDSPAIPSYWKPVSPTQYDVANVNKQKQKAAASTYPPFLHQ